MKTTKHRQTILCFETVSSLYSLPTREWVTSLFALVFIMIFICQFSCSVHFFSYSSFQLFKKKKHISWYQKCDTSWCVNIKKTFFNINICCRLKYIGWAVEHGFILGVDQYDFSGLIHLFDNFNDYLLCRYRLFSVDRLLLRENNVGHCVRPQSDDCR